MQITCFFFLLNLLQSPYLGLDALDMMILNLSLCHVNYDLLKLVCFSDTLKNDANKPQENLSESKPKLPKYSDSSRPNDKHMKYEDYKKHHDSHKSSKSKDKKRKRDREHDKHRSDQKVEGKTIDSEKKFFQKDLLKKSPQLKNFLDAIQIEIGRGNLDFLKPMMNKHSLVDLVRITFCRKFSCLICNTKLSNLTFFTRQNLKKLS